jgi:hypothetical protein
MKKFILNTCVIILCVFFISSCTEQGDDYYDDERFYEGVECGMEDMFLRIHNAVGFYNEEILWSGDIWNTDCFSLVLYDQRIDNEPYVGYKLTLKNTSVGHCAEFGDLFFNAYAIGDTDGMVLSYDDFITYGALGSDDPIDKYLNGNTIEGHFKLIDDSDLQTLIVIIVTEGRLFTATYDYDYREQNEKEY